MDERSTTSKIVLNESLQHPLTLFPTAIGVLGTLTTVLFGASAITAGVAIGGLTIGASSWAVNYFLRKDVFLRQYFFRMHTNGEKAMAELLKSMECNLKEMKLPADAEAYAKQALDQLNLIRTSFEDFKEILADRLDSREVTFNRFLMTAEQVNLAVLDNLKSISLRLKSISSIDPAYIANRFKALEKLKHLTKRADEEESKTLRARQALREEQMNRVNELLTYNEQALTQLAKANASVAALHGKGDQTGVDLSTATEELEELAKRAKAF